MQDNQKLLQDLKEVLHRKKNNQYYAKILGVTEEEIAWAREQLKREGITSYSIENPVNNLKSDETAYSFDESPEDGRATVSTVVTGLIKDLDDLIVKCNIDTEKWIIKRYVQNAWGKPEDQRYQVKAWLENRITATPSNHLLQEQFLKFAENFQSPYTPVPLMSPLSLLNLSTTAKASILIPKQDFHFDKLDTFGDNDTDKRLDRDLSITNYFVNQASKLYDLQTVYYVLGSDYFNSEYTKTTTKGTPQQNGILSYHEGFNTACMHEVRVIESILTTARDVQVIFVAGNHDYYIGWHLVQWLQCWFKNEPRVQVDSNPDLDKCILEWDTAVMLRHGNDVKPQQLAHIFPTKYRKEWSQANHTYIITGDKHSEKSADFGAIRHYGVPALSSAKSLWDQNNGYVVTRTEHSAYIIEEGKGFSNFFRETTQ